MSRYLERCHADCSRCRAAGFFLAGGYAQQITVTAVDIVETGLYSIRKIEVIESANTAAGVVTPATDRRLLKLTTTVPPVVGTSFGFRFIVRGKPQGAKTKITFITKYPAPGLRNPATGKTSYQSEFEWPVQIGKVEGRTYTIDNAWEAVPGVWSLEFWHNGRKLGGQTFTMTNR